MFADVFLDTNVIQGANKHQLQALEYYVKKTKRKAYTSNVVIKELKYNYKKNAEEFLMNLDKSLNSRNRFDINNVLQISFDREKFINDYVSSRMQLSNFLETVDGLDILAGLQNYELVLDRVINKKAPSHKKEEMKDGLIWLDFVYQVKKSNNIYFLSHNTEDFTEDGKGLDLCFDLKSDLLEHKFDLNNCIIKKGDNDLIQLFLDKFKYKELPIVDKDVLLEKVFSFDDAKKYLLVDTMSEDKLLEMVDPQARYKISAIKKLSGPELSNYVRINVIRSNKNIYTYGFTIFFDYDVEYGFDSISLTIGGEITEYIEGEFDFNCDTGVYSLQKSSIKSNCGIINEDDFVEDVLREHYHNML